MKATRNTAGMYPSYAWPGGYPLVYFTKDHMVICTDCANKDGMNEDQAVDEVEIYYEGPPVVCDDCHKDIESAYGEP